MIKKLSKKSIRKIKGLVKHLGRKTFKTGNPKQDLPQIKKPLKSNSNYTLSHVSAFNYGNAGDVLLPVVLQDIWRKEDPRITWDNIQVYPIVNLDLVNKINSNKGLIIGGGGLFLRDTNANNISGWQWPCSIEMLSKIKVPIALYAVGYNRFRGQEEFEPFFKDNIQAFAKKSVFLGLRNTGSINAIKDYLPENLHHKLRFQPCITTIISELYKDEFDFNTKENFIAVNTAFDRSHLRFGENIGKILSETAMVLKELSKIIPIKFYSHMHTDEAILPFLQSFEVPFELVRLNEKNPRIIIDAYIKPKLVIGMRGHAQMIPFGCKTPILSIISHDKLRWFLDDIGKPEWGVDVLSENFKKDLLKKAVTALDNTDEYIRLISKKQIELYKISLENIEYFIKAKK